MNATAALAKAAANHEIGAMGLSHAQLVAAGKPLPLHGAALARAVKHLPSAAALAVCRALQEPRDADAVFASERRKGTREVLLQGEAVSLQTRISVLQDPDFAALSLEHATAEQAAALLDEPDATDWWDGLLTRAATIDDHPRIVELLRDKQLVDQDVQLVCAANPNYLGYVEHLELIEAGRDTRRLLARMADRDDSPLLRACWQRVVELNIRPLPAEAWAAAHRHGLEYDHARMHRELTERAARGQGLRATAPVLELLAAADIEVKSLDALPAELAELCEIAPRMTFADPWHLFVSDLSEDDDAAHALLATLPTLPRRISFADGMPRTERVLRERAIRDPQSLRHVYMGPDLTAQLHPEPAQLRSYQRTAARDRMLLERLLPGEIPLSASSAAALVPNLFDSEHVDTQHVLDLALARLTTPLEEYAAKRVLLAVCEHFEPGEPRAQALAAAMPVLQAGWVALFSDDRAAGLGVAEWDACLDTLGRKALSFGKIPHGLAEALLARLRSLVGPAGAVDALPTLATLLDGEWHGTLAEAVETAAVLGAVAA